jgi:hypothetical protein
MPEAGSFGNHLFRRQRFKENEFKRRDKNGGTWSSRLLRAIVPQGDYIVVLKHVESQANSGNPLIM